MDLGIGRGDGHVTFTADKRVETFLHGDDKARSDIFAGVEHIGTNAGRSFSVEVVWDFDVGGSGSITIVVDT